MKTFKTMLAAVVISALLTSLSPAFADVYWESITESHGLPGQADGVRTEKYYYTQKASRMESGNGNVTITDFDTLIMYRLSPGKKTYKEMKLEDLGIPAKLQGLDPKLKGKIMGTMAQSIQVTPTDETKTIEGYSCRKFKMSMLGMGGDFWVSRDVKGYEEMKAIAQKMAKALEKTEAFQQLNAMDLLNRMDGFPVQSVMEVMGGKTVNTLKKIEVKKLDDSLFRIPPDFTLQK